MKNLIHKLQMSLIIVQALCGTYAYGSSSKKTDIKIDKNTEALWEAIKRFKAPEFNKTPVDVVKPFFDSATSGDKTGYLDALPIQRVVPDDSWPEGIFGVAQSQKDSDALFGEITFRLKSGANPNETKNGWSMLQEAILRGDSKLVKKLLENGANQYHRSMDEMHLVAMAINLESDERFAIISLLIRYIEGKFMSIDIPAGKNMKNIDIPKTFLSPIQYALLNGDLALVKHLASLGAHVHLQDLLNWAAREGRVGVIEILKNWVKEMPSEHQEAKNYRSSVEALCTAAYAGQVDSTRALLAFHDINVNACPGNKIDFNVCPANQPALHCAVVSGHANVVRELLKDPRTEVNADDADRQKATYWAVRRNSLAGCLRELLSSPKIRINASLLYTAVKNDNIEATRMLLQDQRIDVNEIIRCDKTTIGLIAEYCNFFSMVPEKSFKLLCADSRVIINPEDRVCRYASACNIHKFLAETRIKKQNKLKFEEENEGTQRREIEDAQRKEQEKLEEESLDIRRRKSEEFQRREQEARRRKQGGCCICC